MANGKLDSPVLDDRKWQDIVNEAKALIPKYALEWTDHNPSDLGITLIELFAWIVEGMIYRLNRVPEKNFIEFLNLLGITRDPATPASTFLTYTLDNGASPTKVEKGSLAATQQTEKEEGIVFETDEDLWVFNLKTVLLVNKKNNTYTYKNVTTNLVNSLLSIEPLSIPSNQSISIIFGFDSPSPSTGTISLLFGFGEPVKWDKEGNLIEITWLYSTDASEPIFDETNKDTWPTIGKVIGGAVSDETKIFQKNGRVRFTVPDDWGKQNPENWSFISPVNEDDKINRSLYWISLRIKNLQQNELKIDLPYILFNSVSATNAITIKDELLGVSNGKPFQSFELKNCPLFKKPGAKNPYDHLIIQVRRPEVSSGFEELDTWILCDDFNKGEGNYFRLNPVTGTIGFGNYDPTTSPKGHGTIPITGSEIRAQTYRYVIGGVKSNVAPNTINSMRIRVPGVISVTNPWAGEGGMDEEDIEETKRRGPEQLRNRYRAVTVEDYEYLAKEASQQVKKVRCLPPRLFTEYDSPKSIIGKPWTFGGLNRDTGNINVIIIPDARLSDPTPIPHDELIQEVSDYLDEKRTITSKLCVNGPRYLPIKVTCKIKVWKQAVDNNLTPDPTDDKLKNDINGKIKEFLHPVVGGPEGKGWEVGQDITIETLFDYIKPSPDIGFISEIGFTALTPKYKPPDRPFAKVDLPSFYVKLADYEIICNGAEDHDINVDIAGG
ncbi:baseplate J/gp47 family protein [Methanosarcina sp.]|uniref:baseplate J/gp47 family protein n=1 Tax=Methanosarcina sp. TaxID=2213 RepID=UPI003BB52CB5